MKLHRILLWIFALAVLAVACGGDQTASLYGQEIGPVDESGDGCQVSGVGTDRSRVTLAAENLDIAGRPICDQLHVRRVHPDVTDLIGEIGCPEDTAKKDADTCVYQIVAGLQIEPSPREFTSEGIPILYDLRHDGSKTTAECLKLASRGVSGAACDGDFDQDHKVSFAIYGVDEAGEWVKIGSAKTAESGELVEVAQGSVYHWSVLWLTALPQGEPLLTRPAATQVRSVFSSPQPNASQINIQATFAFNGSGMELQSNGPRELVVSLQGVSVLSVADQCNDLGSVLFILNCAFPDGTGVVVESVQGQAVLRSLDESTIVQIADLQVHR